jgi:hypothetical protein
MEPMTAIWLVGIVLVGVLGFVGWLIKDRFKKLEDVDNRLTKVETKLDVLGDINATLHALRTDVELIKQRLQRD